MDSTRTRPTLSRKAKESAPPASAPAPKSVTRKSRTTTKKLPSKKTIATPAQPKQPTVKKATAKRTKASKDSAAVVPAATGFQYHLPAELQNAICEYVAGEDPHQQIARLTLANLRRVCKSFCRAASRVAHESVFMNSPTAARLTLRAIIANAKAKSGDLVISTFHPATIRGLYFRDSGSTDDMVAHAQLRAVVPQALKHLPNLRTFSWQMASRPSREIYAACKKNEAITEFEVCDTAKCPFPQPSHWSLVDHQLKVVFPKPIPRMRHHKFRMDIAERGIPSMERPRSLYYFVNGILDDGYGLSESIELEMFGDNHATVTALCAMIIRDRNYKRDFIYANLRRLCLKSFTFEDCYHEPNIVSTPAQFARWCALHPQLKEIDLHVSADCDDAYDLEYAVTNELNVEGFLPNLHTLVLNVPYCDSLIEDLVMVPKDRQFRKIKRLGPLTNYLFWLARRMELELRDPFIDIKDRMDTEESLESLAQVEAALVRLDFYVEPLLRDSENQDAGSNDISCIPTFLPNLQELHIVMTQERDYGWGEIIRQIEAWGNRLPQLHTLHIRTIGNKSVLTPQVAHQRARQLFRMRANTDLREVRLVVGPIAANIEHSREDGERRYGAREKRLYREMAVFSASSNGIREYDEEGRFSGVGFHLEEWKGVKRAEIWPEFKQLK